MNGFFCSWTSFDDFFDELLTIWLTCFWWVFDIFYDTSLDLIFDRILDNFLAALGWRHFKSDILSHFESIFQGTFDFTLIWKSIPDLNGTSIWLLVLCQFTKCLLNWNKLNYSRQITKRHPHVDNVKVSFNKSKGRLSYHLFIECFSQLSFGSEMYT